MKTKTTNTFRASLACASLLTVTTVGADEILIADFEQPDFGGWKVEGDAFGPAPVRRDTPGRHRLEWFEGKGLVDSFHRGGDEATGRLTSPPFRIRRGHLNFLIAGGGYPQRTCVNLVIGGKTVRTAMGSNNGESFLHWQSWDVGGFRDREAVIEIVDQATGRYGYIAADQIHQSDRPAAPKPSSARRTEPAPAPGGARKIPVTGRYLVFPCAFQGGGGMTVVVDGQLVHALRCSFPKDKESIDWWGWLDMSEYLGKTASVAADAPPEVRELIESSDQIRSLRPLYDEALRPQLRFSQMRGWNNDVNGLFHHDGKYHFFWQCNPAGLTADAPYWGYATSPDMVYWTEQPHALRPNGGRTATASRHSSMSDGQCWSGSGHVDLHNTAGWQTDDKKTLVLAFTDHGGGGEGLAYSTDGGKLWKFHEGNPVIKHRGRDPKLVWYEPGKHWVIATFSEVPADDGHGIVNAVVFYTSKDLKTWTCQSALPGYSECPELFELPVDGAQTRSKWVVFGGDARYAVGDFDGKKFTPDHAGHHQLHWGNYYAAQCFSNPPDGRVVQVGWAKGIEMPGMPFNQAFSLPTELRLRSTPDGLRLFAWPIRELEQLRQPNPRTVSNKALAAAAPGVEIPAPGQLYDIEVTLRQGTATKAVLRFGENTVTYDFKQQRLDEMPLKPEDGTVTFRVITDRPMYEVVGGKGSCYKTSARKDQGKPLGTLSLNAEGGDLTVVSLGAYEMKSIWKKQP